MNSLQKSTKEVPHSQLKFQHFESVNSAPYVIHYSQQGSVGSSLFILIQFFSCHLVRFSYNWSSCSPNYHAARNRLTVCCSMMTLSFFLVTSSTYWVACQVYICIPGRVSKVAQGQVASLRTLLRVLQLLNPCPKGSQNIQIKGSSERTKAQP